MTSSHNEKHYSPREIYRNRVSNTIQSITYPKELTIEHATDLRELIQQLREQDFDTFYIDKDGKKVLVKYHHQGKQENELNPIHKHEAEVQALRYVQGMLLIAKNTTTTDDLIDKINAIYQQYHVEKNKEGYSASATHWLAEQFAQLLAIQLNVTLDNGRKQLTMARDLGILIEDHPSVCTISEDKDKVTIEKSTPYQVNESYYNDPDLFQNISNQPWMKSAKKLAGFNADGKTWIDQFFAENFTEIKTKGVTAPPSARWYPVPANNQIVEICVARKDDKQPELIFSHTDFLRNGILIAYDIRKIPGVKNNDSYQKEIAKKMLREILLSQLDTRVTSFKELYQGVIDPENFNFYINYQTLLSPLIGEIRFHHIDNNAKFVKLAKEVVTDMANDAEFKNKLKEKYGANLQITQTNSAVNRKAYLSNEYSEDDKTRRQKIDEFYAIKKGLNLEEYAPPNIKNVKISDVSSQLKMMANSSGYKPELVDELVKCEKACEYLQKLLDNEEPYKNLSRYKRNIMQAALEHLAMGKQSFTIVGCKSARDRTAIFASAVRTMEENPEAMHNWQVLDAGIIRALKQGHHFRAMIFHSAIVKVSLVHQNFMKQLRKSTQRDIANLLVFSRKPSAYKKKEEKIATWSPPAEAIDKTATMTINKTDAEWLLSAIKAHNTALEKENWQNVLHSFTTDLESETNLSKMEDYLKSLREKQLNSKSFIVEKYGLKVRIFQQKKTNLETNVEENVNDFFISAMDSARSALTIIKYSSIEQKDISKAFTKIKDVLEKFHHGIQDIKNSQEDDLSKLKKSQEEYKKFNGVLADILVKATCYTNHNMAAKGILEARNFLWIKDRKDEAICTVTNGADNEPSALLLSKRISFMSSPSTDITHYTQQSWFAELTAKHVWVKEFYAENPELLTLSATPMQRSTPNPGNAWEEATILVNKDQVLQIISGIRLGITSAYRVKDKLERQRLTNQNHMLMATDSCLAKYAKKHLEMWQGLLPPENEITIPILHQTLIDPGAPHHLADRSGLNPNDMLKRKSKANKKLKTYLAKKSVYLDKDTNEIVIDPKTPPANLIKINFTVKEVNNGINIFEKITNKTPKDISDSHDLILMAREKVQQFRDKMHLTLSQLQLSELNQIIHFIENSTPENPRPMTLEETSALEKLCDDLFRIDSPYHSIDITTRRNLALLMQATTSLASFLSKNTGIFPIGFIRDASSVLHPTFKPEDLRDSFYKSCYERIISELLGVRMGGCKDALDREQEITACTNAMYRQFGKEGKIPHYHNSKEDKVDFRNNYVNTQHKHNMCEIISGTAGSLDIETQGISYHQETDTEKKISSLLARGCRDAKHTHCSFEQYTHTSELEQQSLFHRFKSFMTMLSGEEKEDDDREKRRP